MFSLLFATTMKKIYTTIWIIVLLFISVKSTYVEDGKKESIVFKKIPKKDRIDLAIQQEVELTKDPVLGYVPRERLKNAYSYAEKLLNDRKKKKPKGRVSLASWTERGPNNVGGRTRALMFDPNDASNGYKKVWAGSVSGGLWYNNDITSASSSWQPVDDLWDNLAVTCIAYDPSNTQVFYVGTGEGWFNFDAVRGDGIWKTTNGGTTWTQLTSTDNNSNFYYVQDVAVTSSGVVLAATNTGVFRSTNGGTSWTQVISGSAAADIEIASNGDIYASTGIFSTGKLWKSTNGGTSWTEVTPATGGERIEIAVAPSNSNVVYAIASSATDQVSVGWFRKTTNGGTSWSALTVPAYRNQTTCANSTDDFTRQQAWYDLIVAVHPTNPDIVIIGGIDLYRSTNGGTSWTLISYWTGSCAQYVHADQHGIAFHPTDGNKVIFGNDGGVYYSSNITNTSPTISDRNKDYNVTQFYSCAARNNAGDNYFLAGAQDNGTHKFTTAGINSTVEVTGGDGAFCHIDQNNPQYQITSYVYNNYFRSTNGGTSFSQITSNNTGQFINANDYDNQAKILYCGSGTNQLYRVSNITGTISTATLTVALDGGRITHVRVSENTSNRVFVGTNQGKIFRIDNAHATPTVTNITGTLSQSGSISCIEVENGDDNHLLATFSNYGVISVWETTNGGTTWVNKEGNLPDMPVRWALFDPDDDTQVLLATEAGVWATENISAETPDWVPANENLANVRCDMLQLRTADKIVVVATHGRGLYTSNIFQLNPTNPEISFLATYFEKTETTTANDGCLGYTDYTITMRISSAPTGNATVTLSLDGSSTASQNADFKFTTNGSFTTPSNTLVFPHGSSSNKTFTVRIYNDLAVENDESFILNYSVSGTTNAVKAQHSQKLTFKIKDNDSHPISDTDYITFFTETWTGHSGWLTSGGKTLGNRNLWLVGTGCTNTINGNTAMMCNLTGGNPYCGYIKDGSTIYLYRTVNASGYSNLKLDYKWICLGESGDYGQLVYSTDLITPSWTVVGSNLSGVNTVQTASVSLPLALNNQTFLLGWRFVDDNDNTVNNPSLGIDDIVLSGTTPGVGIETTVNVTNQTYLGPYSTVYFYDPNDGNLICKIENLSSHDYGCTTVTVDRAGTSAVPFWYSSNTTFLASKTILVTPTNNNATGTYDVTMYFTETEIAGWETATTNSRNNILLAKNGGPINDVSPTNQGGTGGYDTNDIATNITRGNFGTGFYVKGRFNSGFSGIGAGIPGSIPNPPLPVVWVDFNGKFEQGVGIRLLWKTATEYNNNRFEVWRSADGRQFTKIGEVKGSGNSRTLQTYTFVDRFPAEVNYYQLKQVDNDGSSTFSKVIVVYAEVKEETLSVYPNPFDKELFIHLSAPRQTWVSWQIFDLNGQKAQEGALYLNGMQQTIPLHQLGKGVYVLVLYQEDKTWWKKIVKQ